ncbi:hypothetical protein [Luteolibacter sp. AS25]|uniref:hypothetical protein n=1 Tax=Luteolibacter sp. AS25 TaxID=3135776 RepID=UPI00398B5D04
MNTEQAENIIFAGGLPVWQLVTLGAVLTILLGVLFWRDLRLARRRYIVPFLFLLRLLAVAGVLFALAEPTHLTEVTTSRDKSFGIYVDNSASMSLVDEPDGLGNALRWSEIPEAEPSRIADTWTARLGAIRTQLHQSLQSSDPEVYTKIRTDSKQLLKDIEDDSNKISSSEIFTEISNYLEQILIPTLDSLSSNTATASRRNDARTLLLGLTDHLVIIHRLADQLAADLETQLIASEKITTQQSRLKSATAWLGKARKTWLKELSEKATIRAYTFADEVLPMANPDWSSLTSQPVTQAASTDLNKTLRDIARNYASGEIQAAVLITDGDHATLDAEPLQIPGALSTAPLFIVPIGGTKVQRDVILHHISAPRYTLYTDRIPIEAMVSGIGCKGETAKLQLLLGETVLSEETITFASEVSDHRVDFSWKPGSVGSYDLHVNVEILNNEASETNNSSSIQADTIDDKQRIFIADDRPRWETRYLLNIFNRTKRIEHTSILFQPATSRQQPPALPYALETWQNFGLVVLGDLSPDQLTPEHQQALKEYVNLGGKLVVIAGDNSMPAAFNGQPLMELLPIEPRPIYDPEKRGVSLSLSAEGRFATMLRLEEDPATNNSLWPYFSHKMPIYDLSPYSVAKPSATVLVEANMRSGTSNTEKPRAYLSWHQYGKGMVAYLASPTTYHLRFRLGDQYHYRFWGQFLQWINAQNFSAGTQQVQIRTDKTKYPLGSPIHATVSLSDPRGLPLSGIECSVALMSEDEAKMETICVENPDAPGEYLAIFENAPKGNFSVRPTGTAIRELLGDDQSAATPIVVLRPENRELDYGLCDISALRQIANTSNGTIISASALPAALEQFSLESTKTIRTARHPLWNVWPLLLLVIAFLSLEWMGRRAAGIL